LPAASQILDVATRRGKALKAGTRLLLYASGLHHLVASISYQSGAGNIRLPAPSLPAGDRIDLEQTVRIPYGLFLSPSPIAYHPLPIT
jgi:hypothetical protein